MSQPFNPDEIMQSALGPLGGTYGTPMGMYGETAEYSPEKYFSVEDHFNSDDYFNPQTMFDANKVLREAAGT